jgi:hypothetical protein
MFTNIDWFTSSVKLLEPQVVDPANDCVSHKGKKPRKKKCLNRENPKKGHGVKDLSTISYIEKVSNCHLADSFTSTFGSLFILSFIIFYLFFLAFGLLHIYTYTHTHISIYLSIYLWLSIFYMHTNWHRDWHHASWIFQRWSFFKPMKLGQFVCLTLDQGLTMSYLHGFQRWAKAMIHIVQFDWYKLIHMNPQV